MVVIRSNLTLGNVSVALLFLFTNLVFALIFGLVKSLSSLCSLKTTSTHISSPILHSLFVFGVILLFLPPLARHSGPFLRPPLSISADTLRACLFLHCIYFPFLYETWRCLALFFTVMMAPAEQSVPGWLNCVFNKTMMSN